MLGNPIAGNLLQVAVLSGDDPYVVQQLLNDWLNKAVRTAIQDIQIQQGDKKTVAMVIFRKG